MLTVNGEKRDWKTPVSLQKFLEEEQYVCSKIAVERNGKIVRKADYEETLLQDGDVLEVVSFLGGG